MDAQNIRIIVTEKSDIVLDNIVKKNNLIDNNVNEGLPKSIKVLSAAKSFLLGVVAEKDLASLLQKDLAVSGQVAEQIKNDILKNLAPSLKKISKEELSNLSEEEKDALIFGEAQTSEKEPLPTIKKPNIASVEENAKLVEKNKSENLIKPAVAQPLSFEPQKIEKKEPGKLPTKKKIAQGERPMPKKSSGADSYREPVG